MTEGETCVGQFVKTSDSDLKVLGNTILGIKYCRDITFIYGFTPIFRKEMEVWR